MLASPPFTTEANNARTSNFQVLIARVLTQLAGICAAPKGPVPPWGLLLLARLLVQHLISRKPGESGVEEFMLMGGPRKAAHDEGTFWQGTSHGYRKTSVARGSEGKGAEVGSLCKKQVVRRRGASLAQGIGLYGVQLNVGKEEIGAGVCHSCLDDSLT